MKNMTRICTNSPKVSICLFTPLSISVCLSIYLCTSISVCLSRQWAKERTNQLNLNFNTNAFVHTYNCGCVCLYLCVYVCPYVYLFLRLTDLLTITSEQVVTNIRVLCPTWVCGLSSKIRHVLRRVSTCLSIYFFACLYVLVIPRQIRVLHRL